MLLCSLCFLLFFSGCSQKKSRGNDLGFAFSADLTYVQENTRITASVDVHAPRELNDPLPRNLTLTIFSPVALQGLVVQRIDGVISLSYEGISTTVEHTDLLRCANLLLFEDASNEIRLDPSTGFPLEILTTEASLQISNFKKISPDE